jgi:hypothetical protein
MAESKNKKILLKSLTLLVAGTAGIAALTNPDNVQPIIDTATQYMGPNLYKPQPFLEAGSYGATIVGLIGTVVGVTNACSN